MQILHILNMHKKYIQRATRFDSMSIYLRVYEIYIHINYIYLVYFNLRECIGVSIVNISLTVCKFL